MKGATRLLAASGATVCAVLILLAASHWAYATLQELRTTQLELALTKCALYRCAPAELDAAIGLPRSKSAQGEVECRYYGVSTSFGDSHSVKVQFRRGRAENIQMDGRSIGASDH